MQNTIVIFGDTGVGKSYICNRIFIKHGSPTRFVSSGSIESVTTSIQQATFNRNGTSFTLMDTTGFFDTTDKTSQIDGQNMCQVVNALEKCGSIQAIVFVFTDRFSLPHKIWYDRIASMVGQSMISRIILLHNKQGTFDPKIFAQNSIQIEKDVGQRVEYVWLSFDGDDGQVESLVNSVTKFVPCGIGHLVIPDICYQKEEAGPEFEEIIAETTKDEGHMEQRVKDTSHYVTDVVRTERRYLIAGPRNKEYRWVTSSVTEDVWVSKMVTRRTVGIFQNHYRVQYDGTKDFNYKNQVRVREDVL